MSPLQATVSNPYVQMILRGAAGYGLAAEALQMEVGLAAEELADPDSRVPLKKAHLLWRLATERSGDDAFGLHLAERMLPGTLALNEYAARNSTTLGEGYERAVRYSRLVHSGVEFALERGRDVSAVGYWLPDDPQGTPRQAAEWAIALFLCAGRQMTEVDWAPREVSFQHEAPANLREHRRLFRAPLHFQREANRMVFDTEILSRPVVKGDSRLGALLDRYAKEQVARLPKAELFTDRVRRLVVEALTGGDPSIESLAARLHMSPRTLQRRLRQEKTSHQVLVDTMRRDLALKYLGDRMGIGEVAYLLGFSETSAFHRAFRRWTGTTPRGYRATQP